MNPRTEVRPLPDNQLKAVRTTFQELSAQFAQAHPDSPYRDYVGAAASNQAVLERQLNAFKLYAPYITDGSSILDWGCRHAPDSCMVKTVFPNVAIDGCDTMDDDFSNFHEYAGLNFTLLRHVYQLPYADEKFDAVISGGVLEHVAFETESLKEIWRILKKDGLFFITFLPNRTSWSENISRILGNLNGHNRTYNLNDFQKTLLRQGFFVETAGYHQIFPTLGKSASRNSLRNLFTMATVPLNRPLEQIPIIRSVASNIYLVARKVDCL